MDEYNKAYKEVYEILKYIPKEEYAKVPKSFIKFFEDNMDKDYIYKVENVKDFENQKMLHQTRVLLSILYRDYWATPEKRKEIIEKDNEQIAKYEEELREKYDVQKVFDRKASELTKKSETVEENTQLIECKESVFKRMFNWLKKLFGVKM